MADPWSTVPELRLNLGVYILCMVGGLLGNILVIAVMVREKTKRKIHTDTWKTNLFLLSLSVTCYSSDCLFDLGSNFSFSKFFTSLD